MEIADAFPTSPLADPHQQLQSLENRPYGDGGALLAVLATPLDGTQAMAMIPNKNNATVQIAICITPPPEVVELFLIHLNAAPETSHSKCLVNSGKRSFPIIPIKLSERPFSQ